MYSGPERYSDDLPLAVMYAFCYDSKEYHEGYGLLYENFQHAAVRFQVDLGDNNKRSRMPRGGNCFRLSVLNRNPAIQLADDLIMSHDFNEINLTLCVIAWNLWYNDGNGDNQVDTFLLVFDLNQWYKEQMPR